MRGSFLRLDQLTGASRKTLDDGPHVPEFVNNLYAALVISPLVIGYWRGTWNLMDTLLFPNNELCRMVVLLAFGLGGHLLFMLLQNKLRHWLDVYEHPVAFYLWSRVYTYVYGAMCVSTWRGGWILIDHYSPPSLVFFVEASLVTLLVLASLHTVTAGGNSGPGTVIGACLLIRKQMLSNSGALSSSSPMASVDTLARAPGQTEECVLHRSSTHSRKALSP
uniref:Uncharacterized protein n=1 Tax=Anopheles atroparvus TaxID=41427 RepID=A0A182J1Q0_ANOAO